MKKNILLVSVSLIGLAVLFPVITNAAVTVTNPIGYNNFPDLLLGIANAVALLIGSLATLMIIWAGILFLTSAGDPAKVTKAKDALKWAVIGIAIAVAASGIIETIKTIMKVNP